MYDVFFVVNLLTILVHKFLIIKQLDFISTKV